MKAFLCRILILAILTIAFVPVLQRLGVVRKGWLTSPLQTYIVLVRPFPAYATTVTLVVEHG